MKHRPGLLLSLALSVGLGIAGCGGAGTEVAGGGTSGTGISAGPVTGFGSIIVNGVRYDVSNAELTKEGRRVGEDMFRVGMLVRVRGQVNADGLSGRAVSLSYDSELRGNVTQVDTAAKQFTVFGRTVVLDSRTVFAGGDISTLQPGQLVEVSGWLRADDTLQASFVSVQTALEPGEDYELKGYIANLDNSTFTLGTLTVDYSQAGLPDEALRDGLFVEVKTSQGEIPSGQVLVATQIEIEDDGLGGEAGQEAEIEGHITRGLADSIFYVGGQAVQVSAATEYQNGGAADLLVDARVEAEGTFDADGVLVAEEIALRPQSRLLVEGAVDAVDTSARTVTVLGVTFQVRRNTAFEDDSSENDRYFGLSDIRAGQDWIEIRAYRESSTGAYVATFIERGEPDTENRVGGPIEGLNDPSMTVMGVQIETYSETSYEGGITGFLDLQEGDFVEVSGQRLDANGPLRAEEVELQD